MTCNAFSPIQSNSPTSSVTWRPVTSTMTILVYLRYVNCGLVIINILRTIDKCRQGYCQNDTFNTGLD